VINTLKTVTVVVSVTILLIHNVIYDFNYLSFLK